MSLEGQQLGEFEILECLGQGGMGAVYKARQISLDRFVALKTLQAALAGDVEYITRFQQEAKAAAGLNHPNLVQVYSAGESEGLHWFAMEYVEGESAKVRLQRKKRLNPLEAIAIIIHVATALDYGWRKAALIHRDIKPDNIFLSGDGEVKLGDLGLAKSVGQGQGLTTTGATMGTPHYMSPEQVEAREDVDLRTDIYSLGCTLFHLLSGQPPYSANSAVAVMMKHVTAPVPDLREAWPECRGELAAVVGKMMQKRPADRPQTYGVVNAELQRAYALLTGTCVPTAVTTTQPPAPGRKLVGGQGKRSMPLAAWIGGGIALLAAIGALFHFATGEKGGAASAGAPAAVSPTSAGDGEKKGASDAASPFLPATPSRGTPVAIATTPRPQATSAPTTPTPLAQPTGPSTPTPATAPKPMTEVEKWFTQVDQPQEEALQKQVWAPFKAGVAELRARYLAILDTASSKATAAGQLEEALAWRLERQSFEKAPTVAADTADTPAVLKPGRVEFRRLIAQLDQTRVLRAKALLEPYDAILAKNQILLTQHQRLDDALRIKTKREEIALAWLGPSPFFAASPIPASRWTDVLALVDLVAARNAGGASNIWERTAAGIEFKKSSQELPYISGFEVPLAQGSFAIETEFTCFETPQFIGIAIPVFGQASASGWISSRSGYAGIGKVDGNDPMANLAPGLAAPFQVQPRQRYKMRMEVRRVPEGVDLQFALGDTVVGSYRGPANRLKLSTAWTIRDDAKSAWIGTNAPTVFHTLKVISREDIAPAEQVAPPAPVAGNTPAPSVRISPLATTPIPAGNGAPVTATKEAPFVNSLGMKFVPVPITGGPTNGKRVLFDVWDTRVQDYQGFAQEVGRKWSKVGFEQGPTHPAVNVSWDDAKAFCAWLTEKERAAEKIGAQDAYRLPSDHEWSCAVEIGSKEKAEESPDAKSGRIENIYPWGTQWPPPEGAGNYGPLVQADQFGYTSPVGSFSANRYGLFDLGGNVWQWCEDRFDTQQNDRVLRGGCWNANDRGYALSSSRFHYAPGSWYNGAFGFRCVLMISSGSDLKAAQAPLIPAPAAKEVMAKRLASVTKESPFVNSLEMKFVPVPIAGGPTEGQRVLFSVWKTRVQDYEVFAKASGLDWPSAGFEQGPTHPALMASWQDAKAFCAWLTNKERGAGAIGPLDEYRLPSDHEWSCAVGIGARERAAMSPAEKSGKISETFPWGGQWPPPKGAGNYGPSLEIDKFEQTSPVGSFPPNRFGLRDLGGNAWEWCEDLFGPGPRDRVQRGASWYDPNREVLLSSFRTSRDPAARLHTVGFRCVLMIAQSTRPPRP
ncbi:MAG: SUMF1/EgtB/PvdO family nonheme iron enzyme [Chthoniobacter sp.]|uniref:SUMF1/EgtB/PvdO family nonheme iron enzyme n=1 Tax=Chthoniobacter sp. TaxID=2510640 RepID=UPI0032A713A1